MKTNTPIQLQVDQVQWPDPADEVCPFDPSSHKASAEYGSTAIKVRCHLTSNSMAPRVVNEEEGL